MRARALLLAALLAAGATARAENAPSISDRIEQGIKAGNGSDPATPSPDPIIGISPGISAASGIGEEDASLSAPTTGAGRLRTTLDPVDIKQRIDKGLTAAGEQTEFPPDYAYGAFQRGWFLTAFSLALDRAKTGDPAAQTLLGVLLSRGLGVKQDLPAAADWYRLAGNSGDPEALYALGQFYLDGEGVKQDFAEAARLFKAAADQGQAVAAREFGYLALQGKGVEKNAMLAAAYMRRAAGAGDMDAQNTLGGLYVDGIGVVADQAQAARWFAAAAKNGHVGAEVEYGIMLFNGRGVPKDESAAAFWFARAADADNPVAQIRLARLLADGLGVPKNSIQAARWYLTAKDHGLDDDYMEDWMTRLDAATLQTARGAADEWRKLRRGVFQATVAAAQTPAGAVDNSTE